MVASPFAFFVTTAADADSLDNVRLLVCLFGRGAGALPLPLPFIVGSSSSSSASTSIFSVSFSSSSTLSLSSPYKVSTR